MRPSTDLDDATSDALLAGRALDRPELGPLVEVVRAVRGRASAEPMPPMSEALRHQIQAPHLIPLDRSSAGARRVSRTLAGAAAAAVALSGVGVAAAQNRLPPGLQDVVSATVEVVGIDLPSSGDRAHRDGPPSAQGEAERRDDVPRGGVAASGEETRGGVVPADPNDPGEPASPAVPPSAVDASGAEAGAADPPSPATTIEGGATTTTDTSTGNPGATVPEPPGGADPGSAGRQRAATGERGAEAEPG